MSSLSKHSLFNKSCLLDKQSSQNCRQLFIQNYVKMLNQQRQSLQKHINLYSNGDDGTLSCLNQIKVARYQHYINSKLKKVSNYLSSQQNRKIHKLYKGCKMTIKNYSELIKNDENQQLNKETILPKTTITTIQNELPKFQYPLNFNTSRQSNEKAKQNRNIKSVLLYLLNNKGGFLDIQHDQLYKTKEILRQFVKQIRPKVEFDNVIQYIKVQKQLVRIYVAAKIKQNQIYYISQGNINKKKVKYYTFSSIDLNKEPFFKVQGQQMYKYIHEKYRGVQSSLSAPVKTKIDKQALQQIFKNNQKIYLVESYYNMIEIQNYLNNKSAIKKQNTIMQIKSMSQLGFDQKYSNVLYYLIYKIPKNIKINQLKYNESDKGNQNKMNYFISQITKSLQFISKQAIVQQKIQELKQIWPNCIIPKSIDKQMKLDCKMYSLIAYLLHNKSGKRIDKHQANFCIGLSENRRCQSGLSSFKDKPDIYI